MSEAFAVPPGLELTWLLSCSVVAPGIDGILVLDLAPHAVPDLGRSLARLMDRLGDGGPVRVVALGSSEHEDDLWTGMSVTDSPHGVRFAPAPGPLVPSAPGDQLVVVVPDLARLSMAGARAATVLLDSPAATLERHGLSRSWAPRYLCIAGCATADLAQVSPHLLDRFAVRVPSNLAVTRDDPLVRIATVLAGGTWTPTVKVPDPPRRWQSAARHSSLPPVSDAATARAVEVHHPRHGCRRPLGLLRLAAAGARLTGASEVTADHVEAMAVLTGLVAPTLGGARAPAASSAPTPSSTAVEDARPDVPDEPAPQPHPGPLAVPVAELALLGGEPTTVGTLRAPGPQSRSFPEDDLEPEHEAFPLRRPWQRSETRTSGRGTVVGTRPARSFTDIAWVDTLRRAAMFQAFRRQDRSDARLVVQGIDLRQHRRAPQPEHLLVLVLDHTSRRRGWDWLPDLAPHVHGAYLLRSAVCVVEIGAATTRAPLRAEVSSARSVLDPHVSAALERAPGSATPLAHGLELAVARVRHLLQHGSARVTSATCVVATDALGNVPVAASLSGELRELVTDGGVRDTMQAGAALAALDRVTTYLVTPPRVPHPELVSELEGALGCEVQSWVVQEAP